MSKIEGTVKQKYQLVFLYQVLIYFKLPWKNVKTGPFLFPKRFFFSYDIPLRLRFLYIPTSTLSKWEYGLSDIAAGLAHSFLLYNMIWKFLFISWINPYQQNFRRRSEEVKQERICMYTYTQSQNKNLYTFLVKRLFS